MNAWISSASATATATVITSSISPFTPDLPARRAPVLAPAGTVAPALKQPDPIGWPVGEERLADDPRPRHGTPESAVLRIRAVVAHHVVLPTRNRDRLGEV